MTVPVQALAATGASSAANDLKNTIIDTTKQISIPLGIGFIFLGLTISVIKIILNHSKANRRAEALEGVGWLVGASIALGLITTIFGLLLSAAKLG